MLRCFDPDECIDPMVDWGAGELEATEIIETSSSSAALCFLPVDLDDSTRTDTLEKGLMELANELVYEEGAVGRVKWDRVGGKPNLMPQQMKMPVEGAQAAWLHREQTLSLMAPLYPHSTLYSHSCLCFQMM